MYRQIPSAPQSSLAPERRGREIGRFCSGCQSVYSRLTTHHVGKPVFGRDHVASPCAHEGRPFDAGAGWWEPAVEVLPPPAAAPAAPATPASPASPPAA